MNHFFWVAPMLITGGLATTQTSNQVRSSTMLPASTAFQTTAEAVLTKEWLFATDAEAAFYGKLRDLYESGKPLWLSETADAACGGNPWAANFIDSFRYLNQLGTLSRQGVKVVMHNTLTGSDYGLIDRDTLTPRPRVSAISPF